MILGRNLGSGEWDSGVMLLASLYIFNSLLHLSPYSYAKRRKLLPLETMAKNLDLAKEYCAPENPLDDPFSLMGRMNNPPPQILGHDFSSPSHDQLRGSG